MVTNDRQHEPDNEDDGDYDYEDSESSLMQQKVICNEFHQAVANAFDLNAIVTLTFKITEKQKADIGISVMQKGFDPDILKCLVERFEESIEREIEKRR